MRKHAIRLIVFGLALALAGCDDGWEAVKKADTKQAYAEHLKKCDDDEHKAAITDAIARITINEDEAAWALVSARDKVEDYRAYLKNFEKPRHADAAKAGGHKILAAEGYALQEKREWAKAAAKWQELFEFDGTPDASVFQSRCEQHARMPIDWTEEVTGWFTMDLRDADIVPYTYSLTISGTVGNISNRPIKKIILRLEIYATTISDKPCDVYFCEILNGRPLQPGQSREYSERVSVDRVTELCGKSVDIDSFE